jgi:von Willebrand factor type A domain
VVALFGVSFLTPLGALFAIAAAIPLAALIALERRSGQIRDLLGLRGPGRRAAGPIVSALVLIPGLVAIAAAQPVVVRQELVHERGDAQAFFVLDTSLSMKASAGPNLPTRLARAKRLAARLEQRLSDVPIGLASFTDRVLPDVMPTTDPALFRHALVQSIGIDQPPPSQPYRRLRATNLQALVPVLSSHFFRDSVKKRLLVVFTDGEASRDLELYGLGIGRTLRPIFVHVWAPGERIFDRGHVDPNYLADPTSADLLQEAAKVSDGTVVGEGDFGKLASAARRVVGHGSTTGRIDAYARISLAPWFALAGVFPLGFLFYRRNF